MTAPSSWSTPGSSRLDGEWTYEEGCLSVPGLSWEITRANAVHLVGYDLDGNEIDIQTDEYEGRIFQHEMDHLDGVLLIERLDADQRREAKQILRQRNLDLSTPIPTDCTYCWVSKCASRSSVRPRRPCRRCAPPSRPDTTSTSSSHDRTVVAVAAAQLSPSPVKAAATSLGLRVAHRLSDLEGSASNAGSSWPTGR